MAETLRGTVREHPPPTMTLMAMDPETQGPTAEGSRAGDSVIAPWIVVVVRAWIQDDRRVVRMTLSRGGHPPVVCYEQSSVAAGHRLARWLDHTPGLGAVVPADDASGDEQETP